LANARGGKDNISAMLLRAHPPGYSLADDEDTVATWMPTGAAVVGADDTDPPRRKPRRKARSREWLLLVPLAGLAIVAGVLLVILVVRLVRPEEATVPSPVPTPDLALSVTEQSPPSPVADVQPTPIDEVVELPVPDVVTSTVIVPLSPVPTVTGSTDVPSIPTMPVTLTLQEPGGETGVLVSLVMSYTSLAGDTLSYIAETWGATEVLDLGAKPEDCIARANDMPDPDVLGSGVGLKVAGHCMSDRGLVGIVKLSSRLDETVQRSLQIDIVSETINSIEGLAPIDRQEAWSPDGTWTAYVVPAGDSYGELWVKPGDGAEELLVAGECAADPLWSPSNWGPASAGIRYLVFTSPCEFGDESWSPREDGDPGDIWVVAIRYDGDTITTTNFLWLVAGPGMEVIHDWYPDE
jgi:hypothetical protein